MRRAVDTQFFEQPGFSIMFDAWSDVFRLEEGEYALDAAAALAKVADARQKVLIESGLADRDIDDLEHVACRYARESDYLLEEILHG